MVKAEKLLIGEETALAPLYQKATAHLRSKEVKGVVAMVLAHNMIISGHM